MTRFVRRSLPWLMLSGALCIPALTQAQGYSYYAVNPSRAYDSRLSSGGPGPITFNTTRNIQIQALAGKCGIPTGAKAAVLNLTVTGPTGWGWLSAWPAGGSPGGSVINFDAGQTIANGVVVKLAAVTPDLTISAGAVAAGSVDFIVDCMGYYM